MKKEYGKVKPKPPMKQTSGAMSAIKSAVKSTPKPTGTKLAPTKMKKC